MNTKDIFRLREETGAGVMTAKSAITQSGGDYTKAKQVLLKQMGEKANKKQNRETREGIIEAYVHSGSKMGVILEINCETDFVARNDAFRNFAHEIAMQIAATSPQDVEALLGSSYWRNESMTIRQYKDETVSRFGENITIRRFIRYALCEE